MDPQRVRPADRYRLLRGTAEHAPRHGVRPRGRRAPRRIRNGLACPHGFANGDGPRLGARTRGTRHARYAATHMARPGETLTPLAAPDARIAVAGLLAW